MSGRYNDRYNERRPNLSFRVSPELRDRLLELQDGSDKTLGEIAESVLADGFPSSNKNHSSNPNNAYPNGDKNDVADGKQPNNDLYKNGFNDGFKNGSNHAKKNIKNRINKNSQKINDKVNGLVKQHLENNKDTCGCYNCDYIQGTPFIKCPKCGAKNTFDNHHHPLGIGDSDIHIPIVSDILDFILPEGEDSTVEDSTVEDSRREDSRGEDKKINFVGGTKSSNQSKKDKDEYGCYNCNHVENYPFKKCPSCGSNNSWD